MIAIKINGTIKTFNSIPKVFELKKNILNYNKLEESVHYTDGFRPLVKPTLQDNQYTTDIYFDLDNDVYTYKVETYSQEELIQKENDDEFHRYQERVSKGLEKYLKLCGEFRMSRDRGEITQEFYQLLEDTLEPVRTELVNGQFITAQRKLTSIGSSIIGRDVYIRFYDSLETDINELY